MSTNIVMLCAAPDIPKPAGLRAARPCPSAKPSVQPRLKNSSSNGNKQVHSQPSSSTSNGTSGIPNRPPPSPSVKAAAALYRQQPPLLPSRDSQLTASLRSNSNGKRNGRPPSGTKATWQQHMATAVKISLAGGSSAQAPLPTPDDAPWFSERGFSPLPLPAASAAGPQPLAARWRVQPVEQQSAATVTPQSRQARSGLSTEPQAGPASASASDTPQGVHQGVAQAIAPGRPSYASKVAASTRVEPASSLLVASKHPNHAHAAESEAKESRRRQHQGTGRSRGKNRSPVVAAPAAACEASAAHSGVQASRPVATATNSQQQSPFASQKSISFGREAATATESASAASAREVHADPSVQPRQDAQCPAAGSTHAQSPFAVHTNSKQQDQRQHPPFREPAVTPSCHATARCEEADSSHGDANSSLGAENRDPRVSQEEARAAADQKGRPSLQNGPAAAIQDLLTSPFRTATLDTLPSFTKPLPASKHKEFPSSRSTHNAAASTAGLAPSSSSQVPDQARSASSDAQSATVRADGNQRAMAPPNATDTTQSHSALAPSSPASSHRAEANSPSRQGQTPWDKEQGQTSPRTPLPMPQVSQSDLSFKPSSSTSGPMASSSHSDSGFSLLWDDDPFWQVSHCIVSHA